MKFEHVVTKILDLRSRRVFFWPPDILKGKSIKKRKRKRESDRESKRVCEREIK